MSLRVFAEMNTVAQVGERIELDKDESHYLLRVRRARPGQEVELLDGAQHRYRVELLEAAGTSKLARVEIREHLPLAPVSPHRTLLLGEIDKPAALEAVTDATVMGVDDLVWIRCARSQGHSPSAARVARAVRSAQRQSGRPTAPRLHRADSLAAALDAEFPGALVWASLADPGPSHDPTPAHLNKAIRLAIGPEGGFDPQEVELLRSRGARPLRIAPWILRSERAVVATLALVYAGTSRPPSP